MLAGFAGVALTVCGAVLITWIVQAHRAYIVVFRMPLGVYEHPSSTPWTIDNQGCRLDVPRGGEIARALSGALLRAKPRDRFVLPVGIRIGIYGISFGPVYIDLTGNVWRVSGRPVTLTKTDLHMLDRLLWRGSRYPDCLIGHSRRTDSGSAHGVRASFLL